MKIEQTLLHSKKKKITHENEYIEGQIKKVKKLLKKLNFKKIIKLKGNGVSNKFSKIPLTFLALVITHILILISWSALTCSFLCSSFVYPSFEQNPAL